MFFKKYRRRFNNLCSLIYSNFTPIDTSSKNFVKVYDESNIEILLSHKDNDVDVEVKFIKYYNLGEIGVVNNKRFDLITTISLYDNNYYEKLLKSFEEFKTLSYDNVKKIKSQIQNDNIKKIQNEFEKIEKEKIIQESIIKSTIRVEKLSKSFFEESEFIKDYLYDLQDILGTYNSKENIEKKSWHTLPVKFERIFTFNFCIDCCYLPTTGSGHDIKISEDHLNVMKLLKDFSTIMQSHNLLTEYIINKSDNLILKVYKIDIESYDNIIVSDMDVAIFRENNPHTFKPDYPVFRQGLPVSMFIENPNNVDYLLDHVKISDLII